MRKILIVLILSTLLVLPAIANADISWDELKGGIKTGMRAFFGLIAVVMFVWAGILFLTAQGDPTKLSQARSAFLWGVVGVIVAIIATSIIEIISDWIH